MEKYEESLSRAVKSLETADHMVYVTFPLIKEQKLLLRILVEIYDCLLGLINAMLQYEYYYKRIEVFKEPKDNFQTFREISPGYGITEYQIEKIIEILKLAERHKKSPFEFVKNENIIIMSEGMKTDVLNLEKIKFYLLESKVILRKVNNVIKKRI